MNNIAIQGYVSSVITRGKDIVVFNVKTADLTYKVNCRFFCPIQENDGIFISECQFVNKQFDTITLEALTQPFVTIPQDQARIKEYFLKTLRGSNFGPVSASRLYDYTVELAKTLRYGQEFSSDVDDVTKHGERYSSDGVIGLLNDLSAKYCDKYNSKIPELFETKRQENKNTGINIVQAKKLLSEWYSKRSLRKLYLLGLTKNEILSCELPLETIYEICLVNPYRLPSIKYDKCDKILESIRRSVGEEEKLCGKINRFVYDQIINNANSCIYESTIRKSFPPYDTLRDKLLKDYFLIYNKDKVYLSKTYKIETSVVNYIDKLIHETAEIMNTDKVKFGDMGGFYTCKTLTEEQRKAIDGALNCRISIITGGAGTGKSTVIREIANSLRVREKNYILCAFTGKAVSRLNEIMNNTEAMTIDRLISNLNKSILKVPVHIVIDECSMVTTELFYRLINAMDEKIINITIVGDCNQLPPIGWGNLMREMMNSCRIPLFYLTANQRIINVSKDVDRCILENANNLIDKSRDKKTPMTFKQGNGFYVLPGSKNVVLKVISELKNASYNLDDILILCPFRAELEELNQMVQHTFLNDNFKFEQEVRTGSRLWCIDDRVMMTKNNYDIGVMNGEEGVVQAITDSGINVLFKETVYTFKFNSEKVEDKDDNPDDAKKESEDVELLTSDLMHSFAVSIHKSQGSEASFVILYIPSDRNFSNFLNLNLLYTAITRTRKTIWIACESETLSKISVTPLIHKIDGLSERLREMRVEEKERILETLVMTPDFVTSSKTDVSLTETPDYKLGDFDEVSQDDLFALYEDEF